MNKEKATLLKILLLFTLVVMLAIAGIMNYSHDTGKTAEAADKKQQDTVNSGEREKTAGNEIYIVQAGDTLWDIAEAQQISAAVIAKASDLQNTSMLQIGQELVIPADNKINYQVQSGESLSEIAAAFGDNIAGLMERNDLNDANVLVAGQQLLVYTDESTLSTTEATADNKAVTNAEQDDNAAVSTTSSNTDASVTVNSTAEQDDVLVWPVSGEISSYYGMREGVMHEGLDIAVVEGTVVKAALSGVVSYVGEISGYGLTVMVKHANDLETLYAHNSQLLVKEGEQVARGRALALSGNTGRSTGPHVHFEIRAAGKAGDPLEYL